MRVTSTLLLLGLVAAAHAGMFVQDGQEYEYRSTITSAAGTMDVATHTSGEQYRMKVRIQVQGQKLNVKISDLERSMFVGGHLPKENVYDKTTFSKVDDVELSFSVELNSNGLFQSVTVPSGMTPFQKNIVKGWAAQLQINSGELKKGHMAFKSQEKSLHGDCEVSYVLGGDKLIKSVSHMRDCENRRYRLIDDFRGRRCDMDWKNPQKKDSTEGLFSSASTVYQLKDNVIQGMTTTSSLVAQMYETEGMSHFAYVNVTSVLVAQRSSSGDISASGETLNTLEYEFSDSQYKWDATRDLKAREPFLSSGEYYEDSQSTLKGIVMNILETIEKNMHSYDIDKETIQENHKKSLEAVMMPMFAMEYNTLKSIFDQLYLDKSDKGVWTFNMFNELLGNTGTTASALLVRDLILANKFDNDRDAGRILTAVPFHIRRPNKQLVQEYEKLLNFGGADRFLKMAIPLAFSHLVKVTCMRAGNVGDAEQKKCFQSFASKYVSDFWNKYKSADNRDDKYLAMEALQNIKFGGQSMKMKDMIYGKTNDEPEFRSAAIWAAGWEAAMLNGNDYFFPVFANQKDDHEVRISALAMIFYSNPSTTDMARILAVLKTEKDYEVINMAYAMFEQWANTINPCNHEVKEKAAFFLKYMKQYSQFEPKWGFGYSKTYVREYQQQKYGYGGSYNYYVVGSHKSTTPLSMGMGISNTFFHSYQANRFMVHLRVEGLAKGLIRKFKTMDPGTWKLDDLQNILSNEMGIRERPDQPVRVKITISVKGANVFSRAYDENSAKEGGKLMEFFNSLSGMGDDYKINHQRLINVGSMLYEQPSEIGLPLAYISSMTASASIKATVKRGNNRGLIFRNVEYDINVLANAHDGMMFTNPARKVGYAIFQSRIYHMHVPRKIVVGVNIIKKELKLSVSRPAADNPAFNIMHAQTVVNVRGTRLGRPVPELKQHCSSCEDRVTVSRGPGAAKGRIVRDIDNEEFGYMNHAEYFDCEMDISKGNARGRAILAFMPYNKNPKTLGAVLSLGIRQIAAYIALYPRAEKCGIFTRWSQSPTNPTTDIELTLSVKSKENGARMFFRGRETTIKAILKANGVPKPRAYRAQVSIKSTPNRLQNAIKVQINRAMVKELGIKPYTICFDYESKYPDFAPEFLAVDLNQRLTVNGKASLKYGEGNSCGSGNGQIEVDFNHETTDEGSKDLKEKWYYKKCMEAKQSPEWKARSGDKLPATEPCYMTIWDATAARHYHWKVKFVKLTNRMKNIIGGIKTIVQAGLLPYYDEEPDESDSNGAIGPFLDLDVKIRNGDKSADIRMETSNGVRKYEGYQLKMEWTKRLRNMRMDRTIARLIDAGIIYPCVATVGSIQTNDNVTYPYNAGSCWTLTSGHCGPNPAYAVFTKKVGNKLAMKAYFGGHLLEVSESGSVSINGSPKTLKSGEEQTHRDGDTEIFKVVKWGSTINVYSFLKVWVATDNVFVQVMPAPSTRGQHCGLCGTFNRSPFDEWMSKDGVTMLTSADAMVNDWKWKC